jgi:RNA polymerase sigma-70 factor (ECF subfamily)
VTDPATADGLDEALHARFHQARAAWPGVHVALDVFARAVRDRLPTSDAPADLLRALSTLHAEALYLTTACARGDDRALAAFEAAYFAVCDGALARMSRDESFAHEIKQRVRARLFAPSPPRPARIVEYSGHGELRGFVRVSLMREAITVRREAMRDLTLGDQARDAAGVGGGHGWQAHDPELLLLRRSYAASFQQAFAAALAALSSEERNLLRYHYVDRLSIDHIGAIYGVHRVSASRRLNKARDALVEGTRAQLAARLGLESAEVRSVLRMIRSAVEITLVQTP